MNNARPARRAPSRPTRRVHILCEWNTYKPIPTKSTKVKSTNYTIDLARLNRIEVINYLRFVNERTGYVPLATVAETLRRLAIPLPDWAERRLRLAGLIHADGSLAYTARAPFEEHPFGPLAGYPLNADDRTRVWHDADIASLGSAEVSQFFRSKVPGTNQDHMMAFRATLEVLGLPLPTWAARRPFNGRTIGGKFTDNPDYPPAPVSEYGGAAEDALADLFELEVHQFA